MSSVRERSRSGGRFNPILIARQPLSMVSFSHVEPATRTDGNALPAHARRPRSRTRRVAGGDGAGIAFRNRPLDARAALARDSFGRCSGRPLFRNAGLAGNVEQRARANAPAGRGGDRPVPRHAETREAADALSGKRGVPLAARALLAQQRPGVGGIPLWRTGAVGEVGSKAELIF